MWWAVGVAVAGRHVLDSGFFAGFLVAHVHSGYGLLLRCGCFLRGGTLRDRCVVARHGDQQNGDDKDGAENHGGFRGEMNQRSAG